MKKNSLLFISVILSSLALSNPDAGAFGIFDFIEGGIMGAIAGKIYDFIFGEENSNIPDGVKKENSKENNNKDKMYINKNGEKK